MDSCARATPQREEEREVSLSQGQASPLPPLGKQPPSCWQPGSSSQGPRSDIWHGADAINGNPALERLAQARGTLRQHWDGP